ncbi:MAG: MBL fold metallo-hydrolase [Phycisphaerales bacterium]|nr:MBL fold metallo-hydrolase [Phycisphaerales bacterium]
MGVPGAIATWAVEGPDGWVLIEAGPERCWPELVRGLDTLGLAPSDLAAVLVTHIHLDHAGAAWRLAAEGVPIHVHEFGVQHLVDPSRLLRSAKRIYGDRMDALWGQLEPCPAELVHAATDGTDVDVAGLRFRAVETPGHARHHHAWSLERIEPATCFTGDAAAMLIPGTPWISLPMPPPELDVDAWHASLDRLEAGHWTRLCLTHGGMVQGAAIGQHLDAVRASLDSQVQFITDLQASETDPSARQATYRQWLLESAQAAEIEESRFDQYVSSGLLGMNLSGVARYLEQRASSS